MKQGTTFMASDGSLHSDSNAASPTNSLWVLMKDFFDQETRYSPGMRVGYMKLLKRWQAIKLRRSHEPSEADRSVK